MVAAVLLHVLLVPKEETSKAVACSISGFFFDSDSNKPLSAVWVDLYRDLQSQYVIAMIEREHGAEIMRRVRPAGAA